MRCKNALAYLLLTRLKNQVKSMLKTPGKLVYLLFVAALLLFVIWAGKMSTVSGQLYRPESELTAIIFVLFAVTFLISAYAGFQYGGSFFQMTDVNLLFPAPLKEQHVLFYGLLKQMGTSLLVGFFLLFQYSWLHQLYGVGIAELVGILIGFGVNMFLGQLLAMVLYAMTSGNEKKRRAAQGIYYGLIAALAIYVLIAALGGDSLLEGAVWGCNTLVARLFPMGGWASMATIGAITGRIPQLILGAALAAGGGIFLVLLMMRTRTDFYEDVLKSAETVQSAITAKKQGQIGSGTPRNIKVGRTGIGKGWGASAFFYKHMLENRRSGIFLLTPTDLLFVVMTVVLSAVLWKDTGWVGALAIGTYMQIFTVMLGRINKELIKPFIYLVPEPPMKKLLFSLAEGVPTALAEAILVYVPLILVLKLPPVMGIGMLVVRITYSALFTAGNVAVERLWGGSASQTVVKLFYIFMLMLITVPGVAAASAVAMNGGGFAGSMLAIALSNMAMAVILLFACRNMLEWAELNQK